MDRASTDTAQDNKDSTNGVRMGVQLTATAVHPDTTMLTQVPGNAYQYGMANIVELPESSRLLMPTTGRGMPWLLKPVIGGGMPPVLPATAEPVEEIIKYAAVHNSNLSPISSSMIPIQVMKYSFSSLMLPSHPKS